MDKLSIQIFKIMKRHKEKFSFKSLAKIELGNILRVNRHLLYTYNVPDTFIKCFHT